jgi:hypothetical protein
MGSRGPQQYWTREAIESIKATFQWQAHVAVSPQAETIDGGCLLYRLPVRRVRSGEQD